MEERQRDSISSRIINSKCWFANFVIDAGRRLCYLPFAAALRPRYRAQAPIHTLISSSPVRLSALLSVIRLLAVR